MGLRRGTTRLPGKELGVGRDQVVARRIARDGERSLSCLKSQATRVDDGAEWLAGQMSKEHAAAAAWDGEGTRVRGYIALFVRGPDVLESRQRIAHHN